MPYTTVRQNTVSATRAHAMTIISEKPYGGVRRAGDDLAPTPQLDGTAGSPRPLVLSAPIKKAPSGVTVTSPGGWRTLWQVFQWGWSEGAAWNTTRSKTMRWVLCRERLGSRVDHIRARLLWLLRGYRGRLRRKFLGIWIVRRKVWLWVGHAVLIVAHCAEACRPR